MHDTQPHSSQPRDSQLHGGPPSDPVPPAKLTANAVCALMLVLYALYFARSITIPLATAFFGYLVLRPVVRQAGRAGIHPSFSAAALLVGLLVGLAGASFLVLQPAQTFIAKAPTHFDVVKERLSVVTDKLNEVNEATEDLAESDADSEEEDAQVAEEQEPVPVEIKESDWTSNLVYLSGTRNIISFLVICGALLYFLLATGDNLIRSVMHALPNFTARRRLVEVLQNVQEGLGSYLAKITLINACLGLAVATAMWMLGMPSPVLWGAMAFAFNFVPVVGAIAGALITFVVALVTFEPLSYAFVVTVVFVGLTSLEGQIVTPSILGRSMSMSPVLVFVSIVVWGWMWGMMGVFLSVPILIAARMVCEAYDGLKPLGFILGAEVPAADAPSSEQSAVREGVAGSDSELLSGSDAKSQRPGSLVTAAEPIVVAVAGAHGSESIRSTE